MLIKKTKRKRSDGPTYFGDTSKHFVPLPYDGKFPDGRKTWAIGIPITVGTETYHVQSLPLAEMLATEGIHGGEPSDWVQNDRVVEWVKSHGIRKVPTW